MKERDVAITEVEDTIRHPDRVTPSEKGRLNTFKFLNGRFVRATYKKMKDQFLVITVVVRKKPFKE